MSASAELAAAREYLCIDRFLQGIVEARALGCAFGFGLIDALAGCDSALCGELPWPAAMDSTSRDWLVGWLRGAEVLDEHDGRLRLTAAFRAALGFRDLLEAKLDFAQFAAHDLIALMPELLADRAQFMARAQIFRLFDYGPALAPTEANLARTRRWMRYTTLLTRYETPVLLASIELGRHRNLLDIGGNSGEFARVLCRRHPELMACVFDLPGVCEVGRAHLAATPEATRVGFLPGNALIDPLPEGFDLISFKSMLHDWPDAEAAAFLRKAAAALSPGGRLLIFERAKPAPGPLHARYGDIPLLLFAPFYRDAAFYLTRLQAEGLTDLQCMTVELDMPFHVIVATRV